MTLRETAETAAFYILAIAPEGRPFNVSLMLPGRNEYIERIEFVLDCLGKNDEQGIELVRKGTGYILQNRGHLDIHARSHPALNSPDWLEIRKRIDAYFGSLSKRPKPN